MDNQIRKFMRQGAEDLGIQLDDRGILRLEWLIEHLLESNKQFNLTAIKTAEEVVVKHLLDSWACCSQIGHSGRLIDIGSGAGFPGLAIKIARPEVAIIMVEAIHKKVGFIEECIQGLKLEGIQAITGRAEEMGRQAGWRESFDYATCRAVGHLAIVVEYCLPLLKLGGLLIAQKGLEGDQEVREAGKGIRELGGRIEEVRWISNQLLPGRCLILIRKEQTTPDRYPRRVGIPKKRPLIEKGDGGL